MTTPAEAGTDNAVRQHIQRILEDARRTKSLRRERINALERGGRRIVSGFGAGGASWYIRDWRTKELIAKGNGLGEEAEEAVTRRLDPNGTWFHIDSLFEDEDHPRLTTPGVPDSLAHALEDWIACGSTSDEDVAAFLGWPVAEIRGCRRDAR